MLEAWSDIARVDKSDAGSMMVFASDEVRFTFHFKSTAVDS